MKKEKKISVIIPIYNIDEFILKDTLDSIINQDFNSFEVIAVDDGSDQDTQNILKSYEDKYGDEKFIYLRQENSGGAVALNNGLKHARSKYISLCDYDDWMFPGALKHMYNLAESNSAEIVMGRIQRFDGNADIWKPIDDFLSKDKVITDINEDLRLYFVSFYWGKLFLRDHLVKNNISFDDMKVADIPFVHKAYFHAKKIVISSQLVHLWRHNKNSISFNKNGLIDYIDIYTKMIDYVDEYSIPVNKKDISIKYLLSASWKYSSFKDEIDLVTYFEEEYSTLLRKIFSNEKEILSLRFLSQTYKEMYVNLFKYGKYKTSSSINIINKVSKDTVSVIKKIFHTDNNIPKYFSEIEKISATNSFPDNINLIKSYTNSVEISEYEKIVSPLTSTRNRALGIIKALINDNLEYKIPSTGKSIISSFYNVKTGNFIEQIYNQAKMNTLLNKRVVFQKVDNTVLLKEMDHDEVPDICFAIWIDRLTLRTKDRDIFLSNVFEAALDLGLSIMPWVTIGINAIPNLPQATLTITPHTIGNHDFQHAHYKVGYLPDFRYFESSGYSAWSDAQEMMKDSIQYEDSYNHVKDILYNKYKSKKVSRLGQHGKSYLPKGNFIFVALQVPDDTVAQHAYFNIFDAIVILSNHYKNNNYTICVKKHPLDSSEQTKLNLAKIATLNNVVMVSGGIHDYIEKSEYVVTVNSGVGIEALIWGKTVITIGDSDYKTATINIKSPGDLTNLLERGIQKISEEKIEEFVLSYFTNSLVNIHSKEIIKARLHKLYGKALLSKEKRLYSNEYNIDNNKDMHSQILSLLLAIKKKRCNDLTLEILNQMNGVHRNIKINKGTKLSFSKEKFQISNIENFNKALPNIDLNFLFDFDEAKKVKRDIFVMKLLGGEKSTISNDTITDIVHEIKLGNLHKSDILFAVGEAYYGKMFVLKTRRPIYRMLQRILRAHKIHKASQIIGT